MFRSALGVGILGVGGLYLLYRLIPKNIEPLPEAHSPSETKKKDIDLQKSISDERKRVADDYWTRWNKENIVTMADKMWDYQMDRYDLYQEGKITRYRWNDAVYPPSLFY